MSSKKAQRRELWGQYQTPDGAVMQLVRGPRNRCWFEDAQGQIVPNSENSNVCPAHCYADSLGWRVIRPQL